MSAELLARLRVFQAVNNVTTKGSLSLVVQVTEIMSKRPAPWDPDDFVSERKGQVAGLGGSNLKRILARHSITRVLASEGGRTSRGNMDLMMKYVAFMNEISEADEIDFESVAEFWAEQVREYFRNLPFTLPVDAARTIGANLEELFQQARKRQSENPGTQYLGTVLQHLVGAKLQRILPELVLDIHGASVADAPTDRGGDFAVNDVIIHCTTAPGEPLIAKCRANLAAGVRPVIITLFERVRTALDLAADAGLSGRVEVWDIQQFLATNIHEWSRFESNVRNVELAEIIGRYNQIIDRYETDPSLRIEFEAR